ncbi:NAD(P)/FAD-dependent oxidoreductase [Pararoseomonas indoligenes]|uniref:FAD-binding oxidoreductase n=1 Tax=Roseomonas indoligenes TaxID=2820811 RepID=A0A940N2K0_9PROT|nr:FAD-binding oxidoreductase [Pararoseomonas indoligenes]MBP0494866.1 FAD-binding oxidoreductase [Pararoseomonas indoligenes]
MAQSVIVLGAGMVGVSTALHLRQRGWDVVLVDRRAPGEGASFGNAGLIQREAVFPHPFPRSVSEIARIARNRSVDAVYHADALPGLAYPLLRYWWNSAPERYEAMARAYAQLIVTCLDEHMAVARQAGSTELLRPIGWMRLFSTEAQLDAARREAEAAHREHNVGYRVLDGDALAEAEPHLLVRRAGAVHWTDPYSVSDPHALTTSYARLFEGEGGRFATGDAATLARAGSGWRVMTQDGPMEAAQAVVALGAAAGDVTRRFGYAPPLFGKRGYHLHYGMKGNAVLNHPFIDEASGFCLVPMRAGIRLTTGAEFARPDAPETPIQMERAEPVARSLLPLEESVEQKPWMGVRPCTPDMLPVIGRIPGQDGLWGAFGHAHQGLTLGPTTGRLLAEMIGGQTPFIDPNPYRAERFA